MCGYRRLDASRARFIGSHRQYGDTDAWVSMSIGLTVQAARMAESNLAHLGQRQDELA